MFTSGSAVEHIGITCCCYVAVTHYTAGVDWTLALPAACNADSEGNTTSSDETKAGGQNQGHWHHWPAFAHLQEDS